MDGWGFRRGGYQCRCKPGYRLPEVVRRPFLGEILERASDEQYYNGFDCKKIGCKSLNLFLNSIHLRNLIFRGPQNSDSMGKSSTIYQGKILGQILRIQKLYDWLKIYAHP